MSRPTLIGLFLALLTVFLLFKFSEEIDEYTNGKRKKGQR